MNIDFEKLWHALTDQFELAASSFHGPRHWRQVESNGLRIAAENAADKTVVKLFALFHDVKRRSEGYDPEHGFRAADLATQWHGELYNVSDQQLELLCDACRWHNHGSVSDDVTVGTCWDADRLDLPRVGLIVDRKMLSTAAAKKLMRQTC